jgi:hypothetical protein
MIALVLAAAAQAQTVHPSADGTLVDGDGFGIFDGTADHADWVFNQSSYEGAISLARSPVATEQRVVWEFNLSGIGQPPITAKLTCVLRGAARFPAPPAPIQIVSYPSDLLENFGDFSSGPPVLVAEELIDPFQESTVYVVNVSERVNELLLAGIARVAFRFQIDPRADGDSHQAFMDVLESDVSTKPFLTIIARIPGDYDNDQDVDQEDFAELPACIRGPHVRVPASCRFFDDDLDSDVDLLDLSAFLGHFSAWGN